jgi:hypothetical protein
VNSEQLAHARRHVFAEVSREPDGASLGTPTSTEEKSSSLTAMPKASSIASTDSLGVRRGPPTFCSTYYELLERIEVKLSEVEAAPASQR